MPYPITLYHTVVRDRRRVKCKVVQPDGRPSETSVIIYQAARRHIQKYTDTQTFTVSAAITPHFPAVNPLNAELNPICHLLALLGAHHILHVSRIRVNAIRNRLVHHHSRNLHSCQASVAFWNTLYIFNYCQTTVIYYKKIPNIMNLLSVYHNSQARDIIVFLAAYTKYIIITFTSEASQDRDWTCRYVYWSL